MYHLRSSANITVKTTTAEVEAFAAAAFRSILADDTDARAKILAKVLEDTRKSISTPAKPAAAPKKEEPKPEDPLPANSAIFKDSIQDGALKITSAENLRDIAKICCHSTQKDLTKTVKNISVAINSNLAVAGLEGIEDSKNIFKGCSGVNEVTVDLKNSKADDAAVKKVFQGLRNAQKATKLSVNLAGTSIKDSSIISLGSMLGDLQNLKTLSLTVADNANVSRRAFELLKVYITQVRNRSSIQVDISVSNNTKVNVDEVKAAMKDAPFKVTVS